MIHHILTPICNGINSTKNVLDMMNWFIKFIKRYNEIKIQYQKSTNISNKSMITSNTKETKEEDNYWVMGVKESTNT